MWDRWEINLEKGSKLCQVIEKLESTYPLKVRDIFFGATPIHFQALSDASILNSRLIDIL